MRKRLLFLALVLVFTVALTPAVFANTDADGGAGTYQPIIPISAETDLIPEPADVPVAGASTWAYRGINEALGRGFVPVGLQSGYTDIITRIEFCRLAVKWVEYVLGEDIDGIVAARGIPGRMLHTFSDTADADILAAYRLGITGGTKAPADDEPGMFNPNGEFTREQAATMILNTCRAIGASVTKAPLSDFTDLHEASNWARDAINYVRRHGIMSGVSEAPSFDPTGMYTREQSIVTFNNIRPNELPKPVIALTFDDGPNAVYTPQVLDKLEKYGIVATFFVTGQNITDENGHLVKRAFEMGSAIENHSWSHPYMGTNMKDDTDGIIEEINRTSDKIEEVTGVRPSFFRPPYFNTAMHMRNLVDLPFIMAGIDPRDWAPNVTAEKIAADILAGAEDGGIILLHDAGGNRTPTVESLDLFIPQLLAQGYTFVTIAQLYEIKEVEPQIWTGQWTTTVP